MGPEGERGELSIYIFFSLYLFFDLLYCKMVNYVFINHAANIN